MKNKDKDHVAMTTVTDDDSNEGRIRSVSGSDRGPWWNEASDWPPEASYWPKEERVNRVQLFQRRTPPVEVCLPFFKVRAQELIWANSERLRFITSLREQRAQRWDFSKFKLVGTRDETKGGNVE